ncbi:hypothetical protein U3516DRAFT_783453 [Neocallimastix sp. 'constans']
MSENANVYYLHNRTSSYPYLCRLNCDLTSIFPTVPEGAWGSETKGETKGVVRKQPSPCRINGKFDRHDLQSEKCLNVSCLENKDGKRTIYMIL